jgi:hypothetical protein
MAMRTHAIRIRIFAAACAVLAPAIAPAAVPAGTSGPTKEPAFADARNFRVDREPSDVSVADLDADGDRGVRRGEDALVARRGES